MKLNTLEKLYACLKNETPEILMNEDLRKQAEKSILKMLEISAQLGL
jgi:quinolinate synthase